MAFFKSKRPHSPYISNDATGISNYKRVKLIQDFERLSLGGDVKYDRDAYARDMASPITKMVDTQINLPKSVKNKLIREGLNQHNTDNVTADEIIYAKIRDWIREDAMQIIPWVDWKILLYNQWFQWFQGLFCTQENYFSPNIFDSEGDYDIDNSSLHMFDQRYATVQNHSDHFDYMDIDVDMD
ncbi:hypothetical protein MOSE0_N05160 [Monosporozyma servazzii]